MSALDVHKLEIFRSVATFGSFSRAAAALFLTQSAVSQQIASLERGLGVALFSRSARGVTLTAAGARLLAHTDDILNRLAQAELEVSAHRAHGAQSVTVSATTGIGAFLAPGWLHLFRQTLPEVITLLHSCVLPVVIADLQRGPSDIGFVESEHEAIQAFGDLTFFELGRVRYVACVGRAHGWWGRNSIMLEEFDGIDCLLRESESHTRKWIDAMLHRHHATPRVVGEYDTFEAIKNGLRFGAHATLLPEYCVRLAAADEGLWPIAIQEELTRPFFLSLKSGAPLSPVARQLVQFIGSQFPDSAPQVNGYLKRTQAQ